MALWVMVVYHSMGLSSLCFNAIEGYNILSRYVHDSPSSVVRHRELRQDKGEQPLPKLRDSKASTECNFEVGEN